MSSSPLPLLTDRAALAAVADVRRACADLDGQDPLNEAAHLRLKHHGLTGTRHRVVEGGFALLHEGEVDLAVAPDARSRGVGGLLAEALLEDVRPDEALTAWSHGDHPAAAALARRLGFARVRELWVLRRPSAVPLPPLAPPPGVAVRGFRPDDPADAEALLAVNAAAFATHPEQGAMDAAELAERMAEPWFEPEGLLLATDADGALLGFHWTKRHDADHGEVYVVGIAPAAQGRGLGKVLTLAGLHHLAGRGVAEVHLYVESDNRPALALYTGLGFTHAAADTHVQYHRSHLVRQHVTEPGDG